MTGVWEVYEPEEGYPWIESYRTEWTDLSHADYTDDADLMVERLRGGVNNEGCLDGGLT